MKVRAMKMALAGVCLSLSVACQNNLKVSVVRVLDGPAARLQSNSPLGVALDARIASLGNVVQACKAANLSMDSFKNSLPVDDQQYGEDQLSRYRGLVQKIGKEAEDLREECVGFFAAEDVITRSGEIRNLIQRTDVSLGGMRSRLRQARETAGELEPLKELLHLSDIKEDELFKYFKAAESAADRTALPPLRFGGFTAADIYTINPSDPAYRRFLDKSRRLSAEPITSAEIGVTGESSVMLVMEHPGQVRVYQVSNDPTQMARNIALIVSKATSAVVKFSNSGVSP